MANFAPLASGDHPSSGFRLAISWQKCKCFSLASLRILLVLICLYVHFSQNDLYKLLNHNQFHKKNTFDSVSLDFGLTLVFKLLRLVSDVEKSHQLYLSKQSLPREIQMSMAKSRFPDFQRFYQDEGLQLIISFSHGNH